MNIVVLQENITAALSKASKFLPSKTSTVTAVNNFLLKAEKGKITLHATDLETTITEKVAGKIQEEGIVLLPAKNAQALISLFPEEKLTIYTEKQTIQIKGEKSQSVLKTEQASAFPQEEQDEQGKEVVLKKEDMNKLVEKIAFSVSSDQARAELTGALISTGEKTMQAVTTDGFRLSIYNTGLTSSSWQEEIIVPIGALRAIVESSQNEDTTTIYLNKGAKKISFVSKREKITSRLIEGTYPDYKKIVPSSAETTIELDREEFMQGVKQAAVFARDAANIIKISVIGNTMTISANAAQTGENKTELAVKKQGEDVETAFNYRFLLDVLGAIDSNSVTFETNGSLSPGVFHYGKKEEYLHIIMPVRLQDSK